MNDFNNEKDSQTNFEMEHTFINDKMNLFDPLRPGTFDYFNERKNIKYFFESESETSCTKSICTEISENESMFLGKRDSIEGKSFDDIYDRHDLINF